MNAGVLWLAGLSGANKLKYAVDVRSLPTEYEGNEGGGGCSV